MFSILAVTPQKYRSKIREFLLNDKDFSRFFAIKP